MTGVYLLFKRVNIAAVFLVLGLSILSFAVVAKPDGDRECASPMSPNEKYSKYYKAMKSMYKDIDISRTCLPYHFDCGWKGSESEAKKAKRDLPTFVLSVGLEGAGHHLWTEILGIPVFDCVWVNGRHYARDTGDGVPRTTVAELKRGFLEQFKLRRDSGKEACKRIYDAEDSFPTGAIRKPGRVFMRPDIINLQQLDGVLFNLKYLVILRNTTDTALSALRRNFFIHVEQELRTVEHTLTYIEAAMSKIPCHKMFVAHYEQALADPTSLLDPLADFLELEGGMRSTLSNRLTAQAKGFPSRKVHKLTQFKECKTGGGKSASNMTEAKCYEKITSILEDFFQARKFMWPTLAGNGFDFKI